MSFVVGQGLFGSIPFADGREPPYDRVYLVADVDLERIGLLDVSSLAGKEFKLLKYKTNRQIHLHDPPFEKPSFVQLDSLRYITKLEANSLRVLSRGRTLDSDELNKIISEMQK